MREAARWAAVVAAALPVLARSFASMLAVAALILATGGCHTYTPVGSATPGTVVRVHVPLTSALANPNAPPETVSIEGEVLTASDTISLATRSRREIGAFREIVEFDTLRLSVDGLVGMEVREFSTARSVVLGVAIAGAAAAFAWSALSIEVGGTGDDGNGGGPVNLSSVVVREVAGTIWRLIGS